MKAILLGILQPFLFMVFQCYSVLMFKALLLKVSTLYGRMYVFQPISNLVPVVPHKAVAEVSRIGNL